MSNLPPHPSVSFWQANPHDLHNHRSTEHLPTHSDIVIIGAGYAGVSTAYHLLTDFTERVGSITILEARGACSGATGRNGGHLRPDLYGHIPTYIERAGAEAGAEIAEFEIAHVHAIKQLIEREQIDCDFMLTRTMDVWCNAEAAEKARRVYERMKEHGFGYMDDVIFYSENAERICGVKGAVACASYTAATMWPYKFVMQLLAKIVAAGKVNLQTYTPALSVTAAPEGGWNVTTPRGTIHADKVIHASNAYVATLLPEYKRNIIPCKGLCCRIAVPEGSDAPLLTNSYINRTEDNVLSYLIPRADGGIIVGGASAVFKPFREQWYNNVDDSVLVEEVKDYYDGYMQRTYRGWEHTDAKVDKVWTGVMGYSYDSNPHVGAVPGKQGHFILAGLNGHGMPVIWLAAKGLAKMVVEGAEFEQTGMPRLFKTTRERIERAQAGSEEGGDILGTGSFFATKQ
ncbi:NAD(P)/FAD-dependent oxidoreductase [Aspergillus clavatus NRRL 1]|uniref:FAD dependent oxidoreductase superfamily n=1 Tax=Aspergillus clavatus (strain ATCC 1007 / CBS 513.65 / DSM 816 / NCTC 3887 / NRRL 1 / QM 1276 / 107) TaxID=344612 RepID=A1C4B7_ASPCL|nr:FAD dependent oxidoreductase superfamily [Aspergillus clavatus NRRL 1]EAW15257.1 FAD dependent oxidoreductase superfamily [Aspergillus clavatus NRRL 1]